MTAPLAPVSETALAALFLEARTHNAWQKRAVPEALLRRLYDIARMGPTSVNSSPMRVVFVATDEAKAKLIPALSSGNVEKTRAAPVTAIIAYDTQFDEHLPTLFPHRDMRPMFADEAMRLGTAKRNAALQGAYLIIAARALGLDAGPMSGFDAAAVDAAFFADGRYRTEFLCNLGYGDAAGLRPRSPRLDFDQACRLA